MSFTSTVRLKVVPLELVEAKAFVGRHHRYHQPLGGHRFSIGCIDEDSVLHGCAIVGRPVSGTDPRRVIEVTRLCTDGTKNACSMLYSAAARAAKALGYERIQTYIFDSETGASLVAAGWTFDRKAHPSGRHRKRGDGKARNQDHVAVGKQLWYRQLSAEAASYGHPKCAGGVGDRLARSNDLDRRPEPPAGLFD